MSTFDGLIAEFPGVSIDQFEGANLESSVYFLSHVHADHTRGLHQREFLARLKESKLKLYSHEVSTTILRKVHPVYAAHFAHLPLNVASHLQTSSGVQFSVTLLPAGHCPGSVMLLFEDDRRRVLYTGDFRLNLDDFRRFKGLYNAQGGLKRIDKVHLDTTFMLTRYAQFPLRDASLNAVCHLIAEWLEMDDEHEIHLLTPAYYGSEYILTGIYERFRIPVHVSSKVYESYVHFPNMDGCVTLSSETRIHLHCDGYKKFCDRSEKKVRTLNLSAWYWTHWAAGDKVHKESFAGEWRVCCSSHASLEEIREILRFLKPERVEMNVEHTDECDLRETLALIDDCVRGNSLVKRSPVKRFALDASEGEEIADDVKTVKTVCNDEQSDDDEDYQKLLAERIRLKRKVNFGSKRDLGFDLSIFD